MGKKFVSGLVFGSLVGATAALLFAPKSGKDLREDLMDKSEDLKAIALDYIELLTVKGEELVAATKDSTDSFVEKLNEKKETLADVLSEKKEALTEAFNEKKEALLEKVGEAKETVEETVELTASER